MSSYNTVEDHAPSSPQTRYKSSPSKSSSLETSTHIISHTPHDLNYKSREQRHSFSAITDKNKQNVSKHSNFNSPLQSHETPRRRYSSFASPSSPYGRRRSFLSNSMISSDKHLVYELGSGWGGRNSPRYSISLKESQGFTWNQDLFASYDLQRTGIIYGANDNDEGVSGTKRHNNDVFLDDEDDDGDDGFMVDERYRSRQSRTYSASNDTDFNSVRVINIAIDENDNRF